MIPSHVPAGNAQGPVLRDIHLPPTPAWWPPAPGWWMLAGLVLAASLIAFWLWWRHRSRARHARRILTELDRIVSRHRADRDPAALASAIQQLLRRVARRHDAAAIGQRGEAWRGTLARVPVDVATLERLAALEQAIYRPQFAFDHEAAVAAARQWLRLAASASAWRPAPVEAA